MFAAVLARALEPSGDGLYAYNLLSGEPIDESVDMLRSLRQNGIRTFALTNFSAETYPLAVARFPFLSEFDGTVVSGEEGVVKPDLQIYERLLQRYSITATRAVFIDDRLENVEAARRLGLYGIHFVEPHAVRAELRGLKLPV